MDTETAEARILDIRMKHLGEDQQVNDSEVVPTCLPPLKSVARGSKVVARKKIGKRSIERKFVGCFEIMLLNMCDWNMRGL